VLRAGSGITERFAAASEQINNVEKILRDEKQHVAIARLVRKVQQEEKEKLLLVGPAIASMTGFCIDGCYLCLDVRRADREDAAERRVQAARA
jgi:hypothetical protein